MLDVVFICIMGVTTKSIGITTLEKGCQVKIEQKVVGKANNDISFCEVLATKVAGDMRRKGYKCEQQVKKK